MTTGCAANYRRGGRCGGDRGLMSFYIANDCTDAAPCRRWSSGATADSTFPERVMCISRTACCHDSLVESEHAVPGRRERVQTVVVGDRMVSLDDSPIDVVRQVVPDCAHSANSCFTR